MSCLSHARAHARALSLSLLFFSLKSLGLVLQFTWLVECLFERGVERGTCVAHLFCFCSSVLFAGLLEVFLCFFEGVDFCVEFFLFCKHGFPQAGEEAKLFNILAIHRHNLLLRLANACNKVLNDVVFLLCRPCQQRFCSLHRD